MNPESIAAVRRTLQRIAEPESGFGPRFYAMLFRNNPASRELFGGDMDSQVDKLMAMLAAIVDGLDEPEALAAIYAEMGRRHAGYGVTEAHYDDVGIALLSCLRETLGEDFTDEVETAWATVYGDIAEAMIAAGREAAPAQA